MPILTVVCLNQMPPQADIPPVPWLDWTQLLPGAQNGGLFFSTLQWSGLLVCKPSLVPVPPVFVFVF